MRHVQTKWLIPLGGLFKNFPNIYEFCNGDINKSALLLRKNVYLINTWIDGKIFMKDYFLIKKLFTVN